MSVHCIGIYSSLKLTKVVRAIATKVVAEYVLPLPSKGDEAESWTDRLLTTMSFLDEKATNALFGISGLKATYVAIPTYIDSTPFIILQSAKRI